VTAVAGGGAVTAAAGGGEVSAPDDAGFGGATVTTVEGGASAALTTDGEMPGVVVSNHPEDASTGAATSGTRGAFCTMIAGNDMRATSSGGGAAVTFVARARALVMCATSCAVSLGPKGRSAFARSPTF
jgi:hypothetical protein